MPAADLIVAERLARTTNRSVSGVLREGLKDPIDATVDLDAELVNDDLKREIAWVFAAMPEKDRRILKAIFLDETDKAEICRKYRVNNNYLRVMLYRARAQFREAYDRVRAEEEWGRMASGQYWQQVHAIARPKAAARSIAESDVTRLVHEYRKEKRAKTSAAGKKKTK
jgi:hypothetical protein